MIKNVCIVGYGAIGPVHAESLSKVNNAKLYAVCDVNPAKIALCLENYDVLAYTDLRMALPVPGSCPVTNLASQVPSVRCRMLPDPCAALVFDFLAMVYSFHSCTTAHFILY